MSIMGKYINIPKVELLGNDGHLTLEKLNICDSSDGNHRARWKKKRLKPRGSNNGKRVSFCKRDEVL